MKLFKRVLCGKRSHLNAVTVRTSQIRWP